MLLEIAIAVESRRPLVMRVPIDETETVEALQTKLLSRMQKLPELKSRKIRALIASGALLDPEDTIKDVIKEGDELVALTDELEPTKDEVEPSGAAPPSRSDIFALLTDAFADDHHEAVDASRLLSPESLPGAEPAIESPFTIFVRAVEHVSFTKLTVNPSTTTLANLKTQIARAWRLPFTPDGAEMRAGRDRLALDLHTRYCPLHSTKETDEKTLEWWGIGPDGAFRDPEGVEAVLRSRPGGSSRVRGCATLFATVRLTSRSESSASEHASVVRGQSQYVKLANSMNALAMCVPCGSLPGETNVEQEERGEDAVPGGVAAAPAREIAPELLFARKQTEGGRAAFVASLIVCSRRKEGSGAAMEGLRRACAFPPAMVALRAMQERRSLPPSQMAALQSTFYVLLRHLVGSLGVIPERTFEWSRVAWSSLQRIVAQTTDERTALPVFHSKINAKSTDVFTTPTVLNDDNKPWVRPVLVQVTEPCKPLLEPLPLHRLAEPSGEEEPEASERSGLLDEVLELGDVREKMVDGEHPQDRLKGVRLHHLWEDRGLAAISRAMAATNDDEAVVWVPQGNGRIAEGTSVEDAASSMGSLACTCAAPGPMFASMGNFAMLTAAVADLANSRPARAPPTSSAASAKNVESPDPALPSTDPLRVVPALNLPAASKPCLTRSKNGRIGVCIGTTPCSSDYDILQALDGVVESEDVNALATHFDSAAPATLMRVDAVPEDGEVDAHIDDRPVREAVMILVDVSQSMKTAFSRGEANAEAPEGLPPGADPAALAEWFDEDLTDREMFEREVDILLRIRTSDSDAETDQILARLRSAAWLPAAGECFRKLEILLGGVDDEEVREPMEEAESEVVSFVLFDLPFLLLNDAEAKPGVRRRAVRRVRHTVARAFARVVRILRESPADLNAAGPTEAVDAPAAAINPATSLPWLDPVKGEDGTVRERQPDDSADFTVLPPAYEERAASMNFAKLRGFVPVRVENPNEEDENAMTSFWCHMDEPIECIALRAWNAFDFPSPTPASCSLWVNFVRIEDGWRQGELLRSSRPTREFWQKLCHSASQAQSWDARFLTDSGEVRTPLSPSGMINMSVRYDGDDPTRLSRLDTTKELFGVYVNRCEGYNLANNIGLITFGSHVESEQSLTPLYETFRGALGSMKPHGSTRLWDAVEEARKNLVNWKDADPLRRESKLRIVVLSDGKDTNSTVVPSTIVRQLQTANIVLDAVAIGDEDDKTLHAAALATRGLSFRPRSLRAALRVVESEIFIDSLSREDQPAVMVIRNDRDLKRLGTSRPRHSCEEGELPRIRAPPSLTSHPVYADTDERPLPSIDSNPARARRIMKEIRRIRERPGILPVDVYFSSVDLGAWKVVFGGPEETPYEGGAFLAYLTLPPDFPMQPPNIRFITPIRHMNINSEGRVCAAMLGREWTVERTVLDAISDVSALLMLPDTSTPVRSDLSLQFHQEKEAYRRQVVEHTRRFATAKSRADYRREFQE